MDETSLLPAFSRRRLLTAVGVGAAVAAVPTATLLSSSPASAATAAECAATDTDEQEVGPFYVSEGLVRSDITSGEDGLLHTFTITVTDSDACSPLVGAAVDVWHASASGIYSDESSENTVGETFLRGIQITDSNGSVTFTSIYPGWYAGRTNHIHARIYTGGTVSGSSFNYDGATLVWTGQMFFDPAVNTAVATISPYRSNTVTRTINSTDRVYTQQHGSEVLATTTGNTTDGYSSAVTYTVAGGGSNTGTASTSLTIETSDDSLVHGRELTISGVLTDTTTSSGLSGETISLKVTMPSGTGGTVTASTGSGGAWSLTFVPSASATYEATYAATSGYAAATSTQRTVKVHYRVAISDVSSTAAASTPIVASGGVSPASKGQHVILHKVVDGKRHTIIKVTTDSSGKWTAKWHMRRGAHHVVATVPASTNLAVGTSRTIKVRRT